MKILVTGSTGQVGRELQALAETYPNFQFTFVDRTVLDLTNTAQIKSFFETNTFDYCINCAAYTAVDKAESEVELAMQINGSAPRFIAELCKKQNCRLIQISTDYVYHDKSLNRPYKESDATNPQGVYAESKLAGDKAVLQSHDEAIVIRTSWVYSSFGNNFVKTMLRLGASRDNLTVIFDQIGTPTYAHDLAAACLQIVAQNSPKFSGIYHYSNEGICSWYDFAIAIFDYSNINCSVAPIETKDYPTPAARPHFSALNKGKIKAEFNLTIPHWQHSLKACLELLDTE
jgi:dTDP-4-dehydrorhamnose reductase